MTVSLVVANSQGLVNRTTTVSQPRPKANFQKTVTKSIRLSDPDTLEISYVLIGIANSVIKSLITVFYITNQSLSYGDFSV